MDALENLTAQDLDAVERGLDSGSPLAKRIARRLVSSHQAELRKAAAEEASEDRLAAKIAKAMKPSRVEREWESVGLDPALAGVMEPSAGSGDQRLAKALALLEAAPTLEQEREAFAKSGIDSSLADMGERKLSADERIAVLG